MLQAFLVKRRAAATMLAARWLEEQYCVHKYKSINTHKLIKTHKPLKTHKPNGKRKSINMKPSGSAP
eukprot:3026377-Pleurochrysis_carterae.AAC.5